MILLCLILAIILVILLLMNLKGYIALPSLLVGIGFLVFFVTIVLSVKMVKGFVPVPIGIRHFYHLIITPEDLYYPIVYDSFPFYEKGFSKTYLLNPKYLDYYDIGFLDIKEGISSNGFFSFTFIFTNTCGNLFIHEASSLSFFLDSRITNNSCKAVSMPSGVGE